MRQNVTILTERRYSFYQSHEFLSQKESFCDRNKNLLQKRFTVTECSCHREKFLSHEEVSCHLWTFFQVIVID